MGKTYILDKTVLLQYPHAINAFEDNDVIIPHQELLDLGILAREPNSMRASALEALRVLDGLFSSISPIITTHGGGTLRIVPDTDSHSVVETAGRFRAILVSLDPAVRVDARTQGVAAESLRAAQIPEGIRAYEGRCRLLVSPEEMRTFAQEKRLVLDPRKEYDAQSSDRRVYYEKYHLTIHEYVTLVNADDPMSGATMLGRYDGQCIVPLRCHRNTPVCGITAKNEGQQFALDALLSPDIPLVILRGVAGTAKTFLSLAAGLDSLNRQKITQILLTRPNVKMDADVGYLKGDEREKVLPALRGLTDNAQTLLSGQNTLGTWDELLSRKAVEVQAMAYLRGRNVANQYMIADEMQNATPAQALSVITRIGEGSKLILLGDPEQIDTPYLTRESCGLNFAAARMKGSPFCAQLTLRECECVRSPLAQDAAIRMRASFGES